MEGRRRTACKYCGSHIRPDQFDLLGHGFFLCRCDPAGWRENNNNPPTNFKIDLRPLFY